MQRKLGGRTMPDKPSAIMPIEIVRECMDPNNETAWSALATTVFQVAKRMASPIFSAEHRSGFPTWLLTNLWSRRFSAHSSKRQSDPVGVILSSMETRILADPGFGAEREAQQAHLESHLAGIIKYYLRIEYYRYLISSKNSPATIPDPAHAEGLVSSPSKAASTAREKVPAGRAIVTPAKRCSNWPSLPQDEVLTRVKTHIANCDVCTQAIYYLRTYGLDNHLPDNVVEFIAFRQGKSTAESSSGLGASSMDVVELERYRLELQRALDPLQISDSKGYTQWKVIASLLAMSVGSLMTRWSRLMDNIAEGIEGNE